MSRVTKTQLYKEELDKQLAKAKRWLQNFLIYLIPWEAKIKRIESRTRMDRAVHAQTVRADQFGSVVSSYFTFLRWIFWVNFIITAIIVMMVVIPEVGWPVVDRP